MYDVDVRDLRRAVPSSPSLAWRAGYLSALRFLSPRRPITDVPSGLSPGNSKTGTTGTIYNSIFTWNLPAAACCPGASKWCLSHCYTADDRRDIFPVDHWAENWFWVEHAPTLLAETILNQISVAMGPVAIRLHSSGDFYSAKYISFWKGIAAAVPTTHFWAYTRSWCVPELRAHLDDLRRMSNVQIFASWDSTMPEPPTDWRVSTVAHSREDIHPSALTGSLLCPEQFGDGPPCASCGFCIKDDSRGVLFVLH